jgi:hypothetical protein
MISEYDLRQISLMQDRIRQYKEGKIEIEQLINDLNSLVNCLEDIDENWRNDFSSAWFILEVEYASMLNDNKTSFDDRAMAKINRTLNELDILINKINENGVQNIIFEDSFVLDIKEEKTKIIIELDALIKDQDGNSKDHNIGLVFDNIYKYEWVQKRMKPIYSKNGEIDYGEIDNFSYNENQYIVSGEWGEIIIYSVDKPYIIWRYSIAYSELGLLSFPDAQVLEIKINTENKLLSLSVDNAYLDKNAGVNIDGGILTINDWEQFETKIYSPEREWYNDFDELKDIGEFTVSDGQIKLKGFGKRTGQWVEYIFSNAQANFIYNSEDDVKI